MTNNSVGDFVVKDHHDLWEHIEELWTFLRDAEQQVLSLADMRVLVEQAVILLDMFYVHMPLKRAMHAIDPVQQT